jgi:hypothetical protein
LRGSGCGGVLPLLHFSQDPLRTEMPGLDLIQLFASLDSECDRHKTVQASGVVRAVIVLRPAVHRSSPRQVRFFDASRIVHLEK